MTDCTVISFVWLGIDAAIVLSSPSSVLSTAVSLPGMMRVDRWVRRTGGGRSRRPRGGEKSRQVNNMHTTNIVTVFPCYLSVCSPPSLSRKGGGGFCGHLELFALHSDSLFNVLCGESGDFKVLTSSIAAAFTLPELPANYLVLLHCFIWGRHLVFSLNTKHSVWQAAGLSSPACAVLKRCRQRKVVQLFEIFHWRSSNSDVCCYAHKYIKSLTRLAQFETFDLKKYKNAFFLLLLFYETFETHKLRVLLSCNYVYITDYLIVFGDNNAIVSCDWQNVTKRLTHRPKKQCCKLLVGENGTTMITKWVEINKIWFNYCCQVITNFSLINDRIFNYLI